MSSVSLLLNVLWIVFGGAWMALGWVIAAVIMAITIVGLPWARAALNIAAYTLFPFGLRAVDLTWLFWTKRCETIAWKGAGHAEEEVWRGADCDGASSN
jgi:uncharacterized membrane protein YccF (DUF307 family)